MVCSIVHCFVMLLTIVSYKVTQTINIVLCLLWTSQYVLNLWSLDLTVPSFSIIITAKTWWTCSLRLIQSTAPLGNFISSCALTFIRIVVIRLIYCGTSVREKIIYFLWVLDTRSTISTNWSHPKLVNYLLCLRCDCFWLHHYLSLIGHGSWWHLFINYKISSLTLGLSSSVSWCCSFLCCLVRITRSQVY